jgi:hypothetical protein
LYRYLASHSFFFYLKAVILAEVAQFLSEDKEPPVDTKEAAIPGTAGVSLFL